MTHYVNPIGTIHNQENGTYLTIDSKYLPALKALDGFSHLNIIWWFSEFDNDQARSILEVEQPYKNSPAIMGIFATRSPVRPNPIALTTVEVLSIDESTGTIQIAYIDANDNTPILDIKPYTPSFDRIEHPIVPSWCRHWPISSEESADFPWENEFNF